MDMGSGEKTGANATPGAQMLTFRLGAEAYAVDILRVKEIRGWSPVTRIPRSPAHVLGVLNLRGAIVPIIDLRLRFELARAEFSPMTVIIVLSLHTPDGVRECGIVVDSVSDVVDIAPEAIKPPPAVGGVVNSALISGLVTVDDHMLILLNLDDVVMRDLKSDEPVSSAA